MKKIYRELAPTHGNGSRACAPWGSVRNEGLVTTAQNPAREVLGMGTASIMLENGISFLEVFDAMISRYQDHASMLDCLHWAIPGPLYFWVERVLDLLICG
eukprot:CAMPEP_0196580624 /NCGR_PEP_ID=MMETSP1081-20130531/29737_1 /TAXON_ID=36882 /ORGANISM="Pyramimonas amylifera, Strain CCMP720" /LENGTH=100 /DNA_ID=CAMNT_0041900547 /DNA_START=520 /DNA_END=818 /DNA_ORIENTATION=-